jgi:hypothetical protein
VTESFIRSGEVSNCRTYTLSVLANANATNVVYTLANLPGNGFDVPGSSWTLGTSYVFTAPSFVTTGQWTLPSVTAGTTYTLTLKFCFVNPDPCSEYSIVTNNCNRTNIAANCTAAMPNPILDPFDKSNDLNNLENYLEIFPNPISTNILTFRTGMQSDKKAKISIANSIGQIVIAKEMDQVKSSNEIDIQGLPTGVYTFSLLCEGCPKLVNQFIVTEK